MDEQMFCFQCEQAAGCTACTGAAGVCGKSAETAAAQDRLTGALIAFAGQLIAAGRGPAPEQARLLMQGLFTTITNVNFDPAAVDALTRRVHDASPGTGPDYDMQALWREPDADRRAAVALRTVRVDDHRRRQRQRERQQRIGLAQPDDERVAALGLHRRDLLEPRLLRVARIGRDPRRCDRDPGPGPQAVRAGPAGFARPRPLGRMTACAGCPAPRARSG